MLGLVKDLRYDLSMQVRPEHLILLMWKIALSVTLENNSQLKVK